LQAGCCGSPENQETVGLTFCSRRVPCREVAELRVKVAIRASITNRLELLPWISCAAGAGAGAKSAIRSLKRSFGLFKTGFVAQ
jgi:hypothetical protein